MTGAASVLGVYWGILMNYKLAELEEIQFMCCNRGFDE